MKLITAQQKNVASFVLYLVELKKQLLIPNYDYPESFVNLPLDERLLKMVLDMKGEMCTDKLKAIVLVGIGGSSLGAKAVHDSLNASLKTKLILMDTLVPVPDLSAYLPEEVLIIVVSKSGTTLETLENSRALYAKYPNLKDREVVVTSHPDKFEDSVNFLPIPPQVGGRFSVFTPAATFVLACLGVDVVALLEGAMEARQDCLSEVDNFALMGAANIFENQKPVLVNFMFHPQLESLGKWLCQLYAESLGKSGKGYTPIVSIGTNDLHSMLQLYLDGPNDKFTVFVSSRDNLLKSTEKIYDSVMESYNENGRVFNEIDLEGLGEKSLGYFMQVKMIEVLFLAKGLGVNAFGQPAVEGYKKSFTR